MEVKGPGYNNDTGSSTKAMLRNAIHPAAMNEGWALCEGTTADIGVGICSDTAAHRPPHTAHAGKRFSLRWQRQKKEIARQPRKAYCANSTVIFIERNSNYIKVV